MVSLRIQFVQDVMPRDRASLLKELQSLSTSPILSLRRAWFDPTPEHVRFIVNSLTTRHDFLGVRRFCLSVSFQNCAIHYHRRCIIVVINRSLSLPLPHQERCQNPRSHKLTLHRLRHK